MPTPHRRAVIITALPLERDAVLEHLREVREEPPLRGSVYRKGIFDDRSDPWAVVVAVIGAGNEGAAAEAERVIAHYSPQVAVFVGVAGAIKDLEHGDVVASTKVYAYESGKDRRSGFEVRPSVELSSYALEQRARHEAGELDWRRRIKGGSPSALRAAPSAKVGPIAAGEKVLASNRTPIYAFIRKNYGDAVAVEMEGHGFLLGVRMNHPTQGIVVRGISDKISNKRPVDDDVWQPIAARHAAAFAFQILAKLVGEAGDGKDALSARLDDDWQTRHLDDARRTAGPRYTAELRVETPLHDVFESLCGTDSWFESIRPRGREFGKASRRWSGAVETTNARQWGAPFPEHLCVPGAAVAGQLAGVEKAFTALTERRDGASPEAVAAAASAVLPPLRQLHGALRGDLESHHGQGTADSAQFRQFHAEYQVSFPAANVDAARDLVALLEELETWGRSNQGRAGGARGVLLTGAAGAGKTHAICDIAYDRFRRGLRTIVVFGEHFGGTDEPWDRLGRLLGFGTVTREVLLATLDATGELSGGPLLLCVDGLNESRPRGYWRSWLASFAAQVGRYPHLRLCVSCRSTYTPLVIPDGHGLVHVEHIGFAGMENTACREFFAHHGLEPPVAPSFHPEFSNPLFLRLACETLKAAGLRRMPDGWHGFNTALKALLAEKNKAFALEFERDARERVPQRALDEFMAEVERSRRVYLPWGSASAAVGRAQPAGITGPSVLEWLLREGLLIADGSSEGGDADAEDVVRVAFERLGEHLFAARLLGQVRRGGLKKAIDTGPLSFAFASRDAVLVNRGLVEALSIQLPEHAELRCELLDALPQNAPRESVLAATVTALPWRDPGHMTDRTREIIYEALTTPALGHETFDNLLTVACQETAPDALWLHGVLCRMSMPQRDAFLCNYLHDRVDGAGAVERLLRSALEVDAARIPEAVLRRWAVLLLWFCVAADRRIRDRATMGLVAITEPRPHVWATLIRQFSSVNDEYVVERCLCAAYGTLLRTREPDAEGAVAAAVYEVVFAHPLALQNALIRDHARCIVELAAHDGVLPAGIDPASVRPPYPSEWPLTIPMVEETQRYQETRRDYPGLHTSCLSGDFFTYLLSRLQPYEHALSREEMARWVLHHVVHDLGYGGSVLAGYDGYMIHKYGGGRGRPGWAERIGKKYQWIALARLAARVTDHVEPRRQSWERDLTGVPLAYYEGRDFDPSWLAVRRPQGKRGPCWWLPERYDFTVGAALSHDEWAAVADDAPQAARFLAPLNGPDGRQWQVLESYPEWTARSWDDDDHSPYRQIWMHVRGYLVGAKSARKAFRWLAKQDFMGRWMPEGAEFDDGFLGEYPWGLPFTRYPDEYHSKGSRGSKPPARLTPICNSISSSHSEDATQKEGGTIHVPARLFFQDEPLIRWDGLSCFGRRGEPPRFRDPSVTEPGHSALLVDRAYILSFLRRTGQCLVWTVLGEKQIITGGTGNFARLTFNQAHLMDSDGHLSSSALVTKCA
jgi:nucleoside phosphorylase